jgi:hypothetical protein
MIRVYKQNEIDSNSDFYTDSNCIYHGYVTKKRYILENIFGIVLSKLKN